MSAQITMTNPVPVVCAICRLMVGWRSGDQSFAEVAPPFTCIPCFELVTITEPEPAPQADDRQDL